ncbi:hypothetical protein BMS3Abin06_01379 [bacterium BMS3Abin06]|nr:hypothetical protein BMS3Abin06_01379 [bacterium BMS3Abin06]
MRKVYVNVIDEAGKKTLINDSKIVLKLPGVYDSHTSWVIPSIVPNSIL